MEGPPLQPLHVWHWLNLLLLGATPIIVRAYVYACPAPPTTKHPKMHVHRHHKHSCSGCSPYIRRCCLWRSSGWAVRTNSVGSYFSSNFGSWLVEELQLDVRISIHCVCLHYRPITSGPFTCWALLSVHEHKKIEDDVCRTLWATSK